MIQQPQQETLAFPLREDANKDNFIPGQNGEILHHLFNEANPLLFIWGETGAGKTHLVSALANHYQKQQRSVFMMPMTFAAEMNAGILLNQEKNHLVVLDDIHLIAGNIEWEKAIFHLFNQIRDKRHRFVLTARQNAEHITFHLPDLLTRLQWGLTYQLKLLDDPGKLELLAGRAHQMGFELGEDIARYLLNYVSRDITQLLKFLDILDQQSLIAQRKITLPFVKQCLVYFV